MKKKWCWKAEWETKELSKEQEKRDKERGARGVTG